MKSRNARRVLVVLHYASLVVCIVALMVPVTTSKTPRIRMMVGTLPIAVLTGLYGLWLSGMTKYAYRNIQELDEREVVVVYGAHRRTQLIVEKLCLIAAITGWVLHQTHFGAFDPALLSAICLVLWLACRSLPAAVLAWNEREIYRE